VGRLQDQKKKKQKPVAPKKRAVKPARLVGRRSLLSHPYAIALSNPFDKRAAAARVPGEYSVASTPYRLFVEFGQLSSAATGSIMILPNPLLSIVDLAYETTLNSADRSINAGNLYRFQSTSGTLGYGLYGLTTPAKLVGAMSSYRVVGYGVRLFNTCNSANISGRLMYAKLPCIGDLPSYGGLQNVSNTSAGILTNATGVNVSTLNSPAIRELPNSGLISCSELFNNDLIIAGLPTSARCRDFRNPQPITSSAGNTIGDVSETGSNSGYVANTSGGAVTQYHTFGYTNNVGWEEQVSIQGQEAIVLYWENCSSTVSSFGFEITYILEGMPALAINSSTSGGTVPIPEGPPVKPAEPGVFERIYSWASTNPTARRLTAEAAQSLFQFRNFPDPARGYSGLGITDGDF